LGIAAKEPIGGLRALSLSKRLKERKRGLRDRESGTEKAGSLKAGRRSFDGWIHQLLPDWARVLSVVSRTRAMPGRTWMSSKKCKEEQARV
jgi:hypothetical protein